jgi:hypothetical protein
MHVVSRPVEVLTDSIIDPDFGQRMVLPCNFQIEVIESGFQQQEDVEAPVHPPSQFLPSV